MAISHEAYIFLGGTQVWLMKLIALFFGYKIVIVGSNLLRDGIAGEFKFQSEFQGFKADLASASPGLLFVLIGGLIICYALFVEKKVDFGAVETVTEQTSSVTTVPEPDGPPDVGLPPITRRTAP